MSIVLIVIVLVIVAAILFNKSNGESEFGDTIKEYKKYESGSIGAMLRKDAAAADRGDLDALLDTAGDRAVVKDIIQWFESKANRMDYYAIRDDDVVGEDPNYAIVMKNDSGYNFRKFSCKAQVGKMGGPLTTVNCVAENWRQGKEGNE